MIETRLARETSRKLLFQHQHGRGWAYAVAGLVILGYAFKSSNSSFEALCAGSVSLLVVGFGLIQLCFRDQLSLDIEARRYRRRQGPAWTLRTYTGTFDGIDGVVLSYHPRWLQWLSRSPKAWRLELAFRSVWARPVLIEKIAAESAAYVRLERYARRLRVSALDRTTAGEERVLDSDPETDSGRDNPRSLVAVVGTPPRGGIELRGTPGHETILLPPIGPWGGRLQIERTGNFLRISTVRRGRRQDVHVLHWRTIREIDLRPSLVGDRSRRRQLFIRSDCGVIRGGHHLDRLSLEWLRVAVCLMARLPVKFVSWRLIRHY